MSVSRTYSCNLCSDHSSGLVGLYWAAAVGGNKLTLRPAKEVKHHICRKCFDELREIPYVVSDGWYCPL